jgi:hypothetical protein
LKDKSFGRWGRLTGGSKKERGSMLPDLLLFVIGYGKGEREPHAGTWPNLNEVTTFYTVHFKAVRF